MSDTWILGSNRLQDAVGSELRAEIINMGYTRLLAKTAPDGTIVYKQLDAMANDIGIFNP